MDTNAERERHQAEVPSPQTVVRDQVKEADKGQRKIRFKDTDRVHVKDNLGGAEVGFKYTG